MVQGRRNSREEKLRQGREEKIKVETVSQFVPKGGFPSIGFAEVENSKHPTKIQARGFSASKKINLTDILKKVPEVI